jgi:hypothetical protein
VESEPAYEIYLFDSLFKSTCVRFVTLFKKKKKKEEEDRIQNQPTKASFKKY